MQQGIRQQYANFLMLYFPDLLFEMLLCICLFLLVVKPLVVEDTYLLCPAPVLREEGT